MMKVKCTNNYLVDGMDTEMVYHAVMHYVDSLEKLQSWAGKDPILMDASEMRKSIIENMEEEIRAYRSLQLNIYEKCFSNHDGKAIPRKRDYKEIKDNAS